MGRKTRPVLKHHAIPFDLELQFLELLRLDPTGFLKRAMHCEGIRNKLIAAVLEDAGIILPDGLQSTGDDQHGQDAWMLREPDSAGAILREPTEIKTCFHLEPMQRKGSKFEYHYESIFGYERLLNEHQLFGTFRRCEDGLGRVVEVYVLYRGSALHERWRVRLEQLRANLDEKKKRIGYSLVQIKKFGAIKLA